MATRFIERNSTTPNPVADSAGVAPIRVDSDDELLKVYDRTAAAERALVSEDQVQTLTNKTLTAPALTAPVITGAATIAAGATLTNPIILSPTPLTDTSGTVTIVAATHANRTTVLSKAAGGTVALPEATGSGNVYRFVVGVTLTSVSWVISAEGGGIFHGGAFVNDIGDTAAALVDFYPTAADSNTFTLAFATTGAGTIGDYVEFEDIAADAWAVKGVLKGEEDPVTPFSNV